MRIEAFRVGDRVELNWSKINRVDRGPGFFEGITGTVAAINEHIDCVGVRWDFDKPDDSCHSLDGACENGYGWWVPPEALFLDDAPEVTIDPSALLTLLSKGG